MIDFKHVYKTFGSDIHCLRNVSFNVKKGELVFLIGPSGAGKTTLFKIISAYEKPSSGEVNVLGHDLNNLKKAQTPFLRRKIGFVLQNFKLLKNKNVRENILLPLEIVGIEKNDAATRVEKILSDLKIDHIQDQYPDFISGGEQQRAAIARALVGNPEIILADEPTGNLDPELSKDVIKIFQEYADRGSAVIVTTHDYRLIEHSQNRIIILEKGQMNKERET